LIFVINFCLRFAYLKRENLLRLLKIQCKDKLLIIWNLEMRKLNCSHKDSKIILQSAWMCVIIILAKIHTNAWYYLKCEEENLREREVSNLKNRLAPFSTFLRDLFKFLWGDNWRNTWVLNLKWKNIFVICVVVSPKYQKF